MARSCRRRRIEAMKFWFAIIVVLASTLALAQQPTTTPPDQSASSASSAAGDQQQKASDDQGTPAQTSDAQSGTSADNDKDKQSSDASSKDKPGAFKRLKRHLRDQVSSGCVNAAGNHCWNKPPADEKDKAKDETQETATNNPPPRSDTGGESSSKNTKIDLSPPPGEAPAPGVGVDPSDADVREFKPWDPHKADKNVEVGDFYFKRGNYRAAQSRYKEALYWKEDDAIAIFRLDETQEKLGEFAEARKNYSAYLKVLPKGEFAAQATAALERLKDKADTPVASVR
jgi:tetratricopeptide (TPR) repeat protein